MIKNIPWLIHLLSHLKSSLPVQVLMLLLGLTMLSIALDSLVLSIL